MFSKLSSLIRRIEVGDAAFSCLATFLLVVLSPNFALSDNPVEILSALSQESSDKIEVSVKCSTKCISTVYEMPNPDRIVIDVANAKFSSDFSKKVESAIVTLQTKEIIDAQPNIARLELLLTTKYPFVPQKNDADIKVVINKSDKTASSSSAPGSIDAKMPGNEKVGAGTKDNVTPAHDAQSPASGKDKIGGLLTANKSIEHQLPEINPLDAKISPKAKEQQMQDAFNFSGYNKERITVEFQKMDLHNVFNFLRQVSGVNIVVDESVQGSLTLVLDDVPWDFALDIILNLKELEKEERFNTLVIYPKKKEFKWPEQSKNNLSFQADSKVVAQEALVIRQQERHSGESAEARQYMVSAKEAENQGNYETAVGHYEKALEKWPGNGKLANKIASIYLVQLRQNAKSLYFSKIALEKDPTNTDAALNAAIASANMQDKQKAAAYFTQCTQIKKPTKEALFSHSAFREEQAEYSTALGLLERHNSLYGEDLEAMIASARIYDKMGQPHQANEKYKKILLSGFAVPPDLDKYIKSRIALK